MPLETLLDFPTLNPKIETSTKSKPYRFLQGFLKGFYKDSYTGSITPDSAM